MAWSLPLTSWPGHSHSHGLVTPINLIAWSLPFSWPGHSHSHGLVIPMAWPLPFSWPVLMAWPLPFSWPVLMAWPLPFSWLGHSHSTPFILMA
jgi:hypothetical protein